MKRDYRRTSQDRNKEPKEDVRPHFKIDREKTCPFLLRIFYQDKICHPLNAFEGIKVPGVKEEI